MSFQPILLGSGLAAWRGLQRSYDTQLALHRAQPQEARLATHFRNRIAGIATADALVADRRLLEVALKAFGLGDDLNNRFFIRKVLEDGSVRQDALANRLTDDRYRSLAAAFGFGDPGGARTGRPGFADEILSRFSSQSFQVAVGAQDDTLRLALNAREAMAEQAARPGTDDARWFRIMGTPPLRAVLEGALGLPGSLRSLDLDQQLRIFRDRTEAAFGDGEIAQFADPDRRSALIDRFLLRAQIDAQPAIVPGQIALSLLRAPG